MDSPWIEIVLTLLFIALNWLWYKAGYHKGRAYEFNAKGGGP